VAVAVVAEAAAAAVAEWAAQAQADPVPAVQALEPAAVAVAAQAAEASAVQDAEADNIAKPFICSCKLMSTSSKIRRGLILPLVLVVIAVLTLATLGFAELMPNERRAATTSSRQAQARSFAESGAEVAAQFLNREPSDQTQAGGIYDNSSRFCDQLVADEASPLDRGRFSVVAPKSDGVNASGSRYGLQDESTKINVATILNYDHSSGSAGANEPQQGNTWSHIMLMGLPGMTDDVADNILYWVDPAAKPRPNGVDSQYYSQLSPSYLPRNGPPTSIEELLSVKGVTPELLFGLDAVKMGLASSSSMASGSVGGVDNSDGSMDHGWAAYLTLWSAEGTLKADGTPKIDINGSDMNALYNSLVDALDEQSAQFIVAYRMGGRGQSDSAGQLDTTKLSQEQGSTQLGTLLDLVGATATLTPDTGSSGGGGGGQGNGGQGGSGQNGSGQNGSGQNGNGQNGNGQNGNGQNGTEETGGSQNGGQGGGNQGGGTGTTRAQTVQVKNPFASDSGSLSSMLPKLFANCTTSANSSSAGRININQASRIVLLCIPNMTSDLADQIISQRTQDPAQQADVDQCPAWPLIKGIVPLATMKQLLPYINTGGSVYRADVIGSFEKGGTSARVQVIIDATQNPSRIVFWNDISHLQGGFPVEPPPGGMTGGTAGK
jgi:DNA uptake protein ComE-like DNA-binding protein